MTLATFFIACFAAVLLAAASSNEVGSAARDANAAVRLDNDEDRPQLPDGGAGSRDRLSLLVAGAKEAFGNIRVMAGNEVWANLSQESRATIDATLKGITDVVEQAIRQDRDHTQEAISNAAMDLLEKQTTLTKLKKAADAKDVEVLACREAEKRALNGTVDAIDDVIELRDSKLARCQERDEAQMLKWGAPSSGECDFEDEASCSSILQVENYLKGVMENIGDHYAKYHEARLACEAAVDKLDGDLAGRTAEQRQDGTGTYMRKKEECDSNQREAMTAMCSFGDRLQEKCASKSSYNALVAGLTSDEASRREKWEAVQGIKCWLDLYRKGKMMDVEVESCKGRNDYTRSVGLIDDQRAKVAPLLTGRGIYTCDESTISFSGFRYKTGGRPSDYVKEPWTPKVTTSPIGQYPFGFCNPGQTGGASAE